jgi:N-acetylneuraminic acid mutarotase
LPDLNVGVSMKALGGRALSLSSNFAVVEVYDPSSNTWRTGPALTMPHGGFAAAVLDGVAYAVGGEQPDRALDTAEALDLPDGTWRTIAPVPTPRHGHAMAAAAGRVWVIGGADRPIFAAVDAVESFAPMR